MTVNKRADEQQCLSANNLTTGLQYDPRIIDVQYQKSSELVQFWFLFRQTSCFINFITNFVKGAMRL